MSEDLYPKISDLEDTLEKQAAELELFKERQLQYECVTKSAFIEQEHRLFRSVVQVFKAFFINRNDPHRSASLSALISNLWRSSRTGIVVTGGGIIGIITVVLMHNANEIVKKQNYHLRNQNYQFYVSNREDISINVFEKLYETEVGRDANNELVSYPKFSEKTRENAFRAFIKILNEEVDKPVEAESLTLFGSIYSVFDFDKEMPGEAIPTDPKPLREVLPFSGVYLNNADLQGLDLDRFILNLEGSILDYADLAGLNLSDAKLNKASLIGAVLPKADLSSARFNDANFTEANLAGAKLKDATCMQCTFRDTYMNGSILGNTHLLQSDLTRTTLTKVKGSNVFFDLSTLDEAKLNDTIFENVTFINASLKGVDFSNVIFKGVSLVGADVAGADFSNVEGLTCEALNEAKNTEQAKNLPIKC